MQQLIKAREASTQAVYANAKRPSPYPTYWTLLLKEIDGDTKKKRLYNVYIVTVR